MADRVQTLSQGCRKKKEWQGPLPSPFNKGPVLRAFLEADQSSFQLADHLVIKENAYSEAHGMDDKSPTLKVLPVGLAASC